MTSETSTHSTSNNNLQSVAENRSNYAIEQRHHPPHQQVSSSSRGRQASGDRRRESPSDRQVDNRPPSSNSLKELEEFEAQLARQGFHVQQNHSRPTTGDPRHSSEVMRNGNPAVEVKRNVPRVGQGDRVVLLTDYGPEFGLVLDLERSERTEYIAYVKFVSFQAKFSISE